MEIGMYVCLIWSSLTEMGRCLKDIVVDSFDVFRTCVIMWNVNSSKENCSSCGILFLCIHYLKALLVDIMNRFLSGSTSQAPVYHHTKLRIIRKNCET